jgi:hypothetical protein
MAVWMDCVHYSQMIPTWKNTIIAKVSRVAVEDEEDDDDDFPAPTPQQKHVTPPPPRHMGSSEPLLDVFDQPASGRSAPSLHGSAQSSTADLLNASAPPPAPTGGSDGSLLDMDGPMYNSHSSHHIAHNDFLGMTAPATPSQPYGMQQQQAHPQPAHQVPATTPSQPYGMQQQQARPQPPQAPRSGGVPMQQQQQRPQAPRSGNAFDSFTSAAQGKDEDQGPFGGLAW